MIKLFRDTDIGGSLSGGPDPIPEDVRKKIEDAVQNHIIKVQVSSASVDKMRDIHKRTAFKSGAEWAYETIALPTIQAQEERIRVLEEENARVNTILERIKNEFGDISDMIKKAINL